jgi:hypothetical protein
MGVQNDVNNEGKTFEQVMMDKSKDQHDEMSVDELKSGIFRMLCRDIDNFCGGNKTISDDK